MNYKSNLTNWLNKTNKYYNNYSTKPYLSKNDLNYYYYKNDPDIELNQNHMIDILHADEQKYIQYYKNNKFYLDQSTNIFECNKIFRNLIDETLEYDLYLNIPIIGNNNKIYYESQNIFDKNMKKSFYDFVRNYSL